jgi:hypothetical protein
VRMGLAGRLAAEGGERGARLDQAVVGITSRWASGGEERGYQKSRQGGVLEAEEGGNIPADCWRHPQLLYPTASRGGTSHTCSWDCRIGDGAGGSLERILKQS